MYMYVYIYTERETHWCNVLPTTRYIICIYIYMILYIYNYPWRSPPSPHPHFPSLFQDDNSAYTWRFKNAVLGKQVLRPPPLDYDAAHTGTHTYYILAYILVYTNILVY